MHGSLLYTQVHDEMLAQASLKFTGVVPHTKEAYYYRQIFEDLFPDCHHLTPYYWMPTGKWRSDTNDPSGRAQNYDVQ